MAKMKIIILVQSSMKNANKLILYRIALKNAIKINKQFKYLILQKLLKN